MQWKKEYEIGNEDIDNQHRDLVKIIDKYNHSISDPAIDSYKQIGVTLKYLIDYTHYHFDSEESYMRKIKYPELEKHHVIHQELIYQLREILKKIKYERPYTPVEFYYFLASWLNDHILDEDQKIKKYVDKSDTIIFSKAVLRDPWYVVDIVKPNLKKISLLKENNILNDTEVYVRRRFYLENYYDNYEVKDCQALLVILESIKLLYDKNLIEEIEVFHVMDFIEHTVNIQRIISREDDSELINKVKLLEDFLRNIV